MKDILHLNMYLITNLLTVYTVFKFFKIFFMKRNIKNIKFQVIFYII